MREKKSNDSRRKLLKSIAAGSGAVVAGKSLPESWSKPVVDAVILPAHAETTDGSDSSGDNATTAPPCCVTPGSYCAIVDGEGRWVGIQIIVNAANEVLAWAVYDGPQYSGEDTVLCTGGGFDITAADTAPPGAPSEAAQNIQDLPPLPQAVNIAGTVVCGQDYIDGTFNDGSGERTYRATATVGKCDFGGN